MVGVLPAGTRVQLSEDAEDLVRRHKLNFLPLVVLRPDGTDVLYFEDTGRLWRLQTKPFRIAKVA